MKNNLEILMKQNKINALNLSKKIGISRLTIANIIHNKSTGIQFDTLDKLCKYFNCNVGDIFFIDSSK